MIRLCACFGIDIDLIEPCGFPFSLKALKRTAMDYIDLAKIDCHDDFDSFISKYKYKRRLILLTVKSQETIWDFKFKSNDILLVGSESKGVPNVVRDSVSFNVKIPIVSHTRCLNVTTAASIGLSEAVRQNNK